jgi:hypothetical protein
VQAQQAATTAATLAIPPTMAELIAAVRYATINQVAKVRPFSPAALRDLKFKAHDRKNSRGEIIKGNGTGPAGVWLQVGAKVLIDLDAFDRWLESHRIGSVQ